MTISKSLCLLLLGAFSLSAIVSSCADDEAFSNVGQLMDNPIDEQSAEYDFSFSSVSVTFRLSETADASKCNYLVYSSNENMSHGEVVQLKRDASGAAGCTFLLSGLSQNSDYYYYVCENYPQNVRYPLDKCVAYGHHSAVKKFQTGGQIELRNIYFTDWDGSEKSMATSTSVLDYGITIKGGISSYNKKGSRHGTTYTSWINPSVNIAGGENTVYLYAPYNADLDSQMRPSYVLLKGIYETKPNEVFVQRMVIENRFVEPVMQHAYVRVAFHIMASPAYTERATLQSLQLGQTDETIPTYGYLNLDNNRFDYYTSYNAQLYSTTPNASFSLTSPRDVTCYVLPAQKQGTLTLALGINGTTYETTLDADTDGWQMGKTVNVNVMYDGSGIITHQQ